MHHLFHREDVMTFSTSSAQVSALFACSRGPNSLTLPEGVSGFIPRFHLDQLAFVCKSLKKLRARDMNKKSSKTWIRKLQGLCLLINWMRRSSPLLRNDEAMIGVVTNPQEMRTDGVHPVLLQGARCTLRNR